MKSFVVLTCLVFACGGFVGSQGGTLNATLQLLMRFHTDAKTVLNIISHSKAHEKPHDNSNSANDNAKRENDPLIDAMRDDRNIAKREFDINRKVFRTGVYPLPVDKYIMNAMFAILGEDGVLTRGGFYMDGDIHKNGDAALTLVKGFHNRTSFIDNLEEARHKPLDTTPLSVITHLLVSPQDLDKMVAWQRHKISQGISTQYDMCAPKLVIMYSCCTTTANPYLGPIFGNLKAGCD